MHVFEDRVDAGLRLATALAVHPSITAATRIVVLGVPRGGIPVGAEIARALGAPLDVVVVRKLRSPHNPELGFGAVGPDGHVDLHHDLIRRLGLTEAEVQAEIADRHAAVDRRLALYRGSGPPADLAEAVVVVADDGVATGYSARLACAYARRAGARAVVFAAPVGPAEVLAELADVADDVVVLSTPEEFLSVGQAYVDFRQLSDDEVVAALHAAGVS